MSRRNDSSRRKNTCCELPSVRGSESCREAQEDSEPALVADRGHVGRDAHEVDGAVHGLPGPEEHALTEVVVGLRRSREVHGQVGDRRVSAGTAPETMP